MLVGFSKYLLSEAGKAGAETDSAGKLFELETQRSLMGSHPEHFRDDAGDTPGAAHKKHRERLGSSADTVIQHARSAAKALKDHIASSHPGYHIERTTWTSNRADMQRFHDLHKTGHKQTEHDNADFVVSLKHPKTGHTVHVGISSKYTAKGSDKTPGLGTLAKISGSKSEDAQKIINHHNAMINKLVEPHYPGFSKLSEKNKRPIFRQMRTENPEMHKAANEIGRQRNEALIKHYHDALNARSLEDKKKAVKVLSGAGEKSIPTYKLRVNPSNSKATVEDDDIKKSKAIDNASNISFSSKRGTVTANSGEKPLAHLEVRSYSTNSSPHIPYFGTKWRGGK